MNLTAAKNWKTVKLGDLVEILDSKRVPLSSIERAQRRGLFPYYGASGIIDHVDDYLFNGEYLLVSEDGENLNTRNTPLAFIANGKFWVNNHAHILWGKAPHINKYLELYFSRLDISPYISGAVQPKLSKSNLESIPILISENEQEQKDVVSLLGCLDDKIELLRKENKTLEAIAQTLFKEWFVNFNFPGATGRTIDSELGEIPEGWRVGRLGEVCDVSIGRTPPRKEEEWFSENPSDVKWISIKDMGVSGAYIFETSEYLTKEAVEEFNIPVLPENTVVVSFKMTLGRVAITTEKMLSNEAIAHLKIKEGVVPEFLYLAMKNFDFNSLGSTSSIVSAVNSQSIKGIEMLVPCQEIMDAFGEAIKPIFRKLKMNAKEIQTLSKLRDELLDKIFAN